MRGAQRARFYRDEYAPLGPPLQAVVEPSLRVHVRPAEIETSTTSRSCVWRTGASTRSWTRRCTGCRTPRRGVSTLNARLMANGDNVLLVAVTGIQVDDQATIDFYDLCGYRAQATIRLRK